MWIHKSIQRPTCGTCIHYVEHGIGLNSTNILRVCGHPSYYTINPGPTLIMNTVEYNTNACSSYNNLDKGINSEPWDASIQDEPYYN